MEHPVKQRDALAEIAAIKIRSKYGSAFSELWERISAIDAAFEVQPVADSESLRYFPVALVGCIEGYVRLRVRDLIDFGEPYFSNSAELAKNIKLDFSHLKAVQGNIVTVGELISHSIQLSRLDQVMSVFERLVGAEFRDSLTNAADIFGNDEARMGRILKEPESTFAAVPKHSIRDI